MAKAAIRKKKFQQRFQAVLDELHDKFGEGIPFEELGLAFDKLNPFRKLAAKNARRTKSWNLGKIGYNPPKCNLSSRALKRHRREINRRKRQRSSHER